MLIYAPSLDVFKSKYSTYTSTGSEVYRAIAFTEDGKIITHGKVFNTVVGESSITGVSNIDGSPVVLGVKNGSITATLEDKSQDLGITDPATAKTVGGTTVTGTEISAINLPSITVDKYGLVTAASQTDILGTINGLINTALGGITTGLVYKGTTTKLPTENLEDNTYYIASASFTIDGTGEKLESGDVLIYSNETWNYVQRNIDSSLLLPTGGSSGQFLRKSASGYEWADITDTTYNLVFGNNATDTASVQSKNPSYINFVENNAVTQSIQIGDNLTLTSAGVLSSTNTWRSVQVYKIANVNNVNTQDDSIDNFLTDTGTNPLKFAKTFTVNGSSEIDLVWEEIDSNGNVSYSI